mmetsp:Transcript_9331/g.22185  ORF Transcript_9331/g.22185 Transcript_9331/m.22185 type:complete len:265 (+) Transcript_9331:147-941(+)
MSLLQSHRRRCASRPRGWSLRSASSCRTLSSTGFLRRCAGSCWAQHWAMPTLCWPPLDLARRWRPSFRWPRWGLPPCWPRQRCACRASLIGRPAECSACSPAARLSSSWLARWRPACCAPPHRVAMATGGGLRPPHRMRCSWSPCSQRYSPAFRCCTAACPCSWPPLRRRWCWPCGAILSSPSMTWPLSACAEEAACCCCCCSWSPARGGARRSTAPPSLRLKAASSCRWLSYSSREKPKVARSGGARASATSPSMVVSLDPSI